MPAEEDPEHPSVDPVMDWDDRFKQIYEDTKKYTMTSKERMYSLYNAVTYIVDNGIEGDLVECGVWRGGSTMLIARTLRALGDTDRRIYLFDTFEGMVKPTEQDYQVTKESHRALDRWKQERAKDRYDWCLATLEEVKENMASTGYPEEKVVYVKGKVEDTWPRPSPNPSPCFDWTRTGTSRRNSSSNTSTRASRGTASSSSTTTATGRARRKPLTTISPASGCCSTGSTSQVGSA